MVEAPTLAVPTEGNEVEPRAPHAHLEGLIRQLYDTLEAVDYFHPPDRNRRRRTRSARSSPNPIGPPERSSFSGIVRALAQGASLRLTFQRPPPCARLRNLPRTPGEAAAAPTNTSGGAVQGSEQKQIGVRTCRSAQAPSISSTAGWARKRLGRRTTQSPVNRREYGPGQHGRAAGQGLRFRASSCAPRQKLKGYYCDVTEKQFKRAYTEAAR